MIGDSDIRESLRHHLARLFEHDDDVFVIDEMVVCNGEARVDVAILNGSMHGYEIKSERDTLERLPRQIEVYGTVFDYLTLVCSECFLARAEEMVPHWWGLSCAVANSGSVQIIDYRLPIQNNHQDAQCLLRFLRKSEVEGMLSAAGLSRKELRYPKFVLWERAAQLYSLEDIQVYVRECLKSRQGWRVDQLHESCGGSARL